MVRNSIKVELRGISEKTRPTWCVANFGCMCQVIHRVEPLSEMGSAGRCWPGCGFLGGALIFIIGLIHIRVEREKRDSLHNIFMMLLRTAEHEVIA